MRCHIHTKAEITKGEFCRGQPLSLYNLPIRQNQQQHLQICKSPRQEVESVQKANNMLFYLELPQLIHPGTSARMTSPLWVDPPLHSEFSRGKQVILKAIGAEFKPERYHWPSTLSCTYYFKSQPDHLPLWHTHIIITATSGLRKVKTWSHVKMKTFIFHRVAILFISLLLLLLFSMIKSYRHRGYSVLVAVIIKVLILSPMVSMPISLFRKILTKAITQK